MKQTHTFIFKEEGANYYSSFQVDAEHSVDARNTFNLIHEGKFLIAHLVSENKPQFKFLA